MSTSQFDEHAQGYRETVNASLAGTGADVLAVNRDKATILLSLVSRLLGDVRGCRMLEVGCGIGTLSVCLADRVGWFVGADVSLASLGRARREALGGCFLGYDGGELPLAAGSFDVVLASCVLHHVLPSQWFAVVGEMVRVVRPGGVVFILEHNPINPVARWIVSRCPFDEGAVLLRAGRGISLLRGAGLVGVDMRYTMFWPGRTPLVLRLEELVTWLPLGAQYIAWGVKSKVG